MRLRPIPAAFACALSCWAAPAQPARVSVPAWIEDGGAGPVRFEAALNGKAAQVISQLGPSSDQIVLLVLDVTGDASLADPARQALASEIAKLAPRTWVGVLSSQDGLHVLADPGPDRRAAEQAVENIPNSGNPGLLETVQAALALGDGMLRKSPVRVAVVYVTDSNVVRYREDYTNPVINQSDPHDLSRRFPEALIEEKIAKLVDATTALEAPLFVVHLHYRNDRLNRAYQNGLKTLAEETGGQADICRSIAEIPEAISAAFNRIASAWRLTLAVPPKIHGIAQVHLAGHSAEQELRLSWRGHVEAQAAVVAARRPRSQKTP